ncbi:MAG: L-threonine 3-dehydrogenase [Sulfurimonadaceae bacterium]|nr:L-threonine 3-dehydrogenase [Sulfurimonadaceae bacterium]
MKRILVTGATGQIGSELVPALRIRYGSENVVAAGHRRKPDDEFIGSGPYETVETTDADSVSALVEKYDIDTIFHLAALLSAKAEENPQLAWHINMSGLQTVLEVAREHHCALFFPSSIGAFGPSTPPDNTPQMTIQRPDPMYGITKVAGELLCDYYHKKYGVDTRGVRFPGLISHKRLPSGGTTDYAVEIFYAAVKNEPYRCFLKEGTRLDMMYMPDAIRAVIELMEADASKLAHRNAYNIAAMSFTPEQLCAAIKEELPGFSMSYDVDPLRESIAQSWPHKMDDSAARAEWGWEPHYGIEAMTKDMIEKLRAKEVSHGT